MVDEVERDQMLEPLDSRERRLTSKGPVWKAPNAVEVLQNLPFLRGLPRSIVDVCASCLSLSTLPFSTFLVINFRHAIPLVHRTSLASWLVCL